MGPIKRRRGVGKRGRTTNYKFRHRGGWMDEEMKLGKKAPRSEVRNLIQKGLTHM